jgi:hypothetical protein
MLQILYNPLTGDLNEIIQYPTLKLCLLRLRSLQADADVGAWRSGA